MSWMLYVREERFIVFSESFISEGSLGGFIWCERDRKGYIFSVLKVMLMLKCYLLLIGMEILLYLFKDGKLDIVFILVLFVI